MPDGARTVCTACRMDAPLTGFWTQVDNPVVRKFWGLVPVVNASAFLFFVRGNGYRDLIHGFKYYGRWRQALEMGAWYGGELAAGGSMPEWMSSFPSPCTCASASAAVTIRLNTSPAALRRVSACRWMSTACAATGTIRARRSKSIGSGGRMYGVSFPCAARASVRQTYPPRGRRADYGSDGNLLCRSYPGRRTRRSHQYRRPCRLPPQPRSGLTDKRWFAAIRNDSGRMMVRRNMAGRDR